MRFSNTVTWLRYSVIPQPANRFEHSYKTLPRFVVSSTLALATFFLLAHFARRPTSRLVRVMLLPPITLLSLHSAFSYRWPGADHNIFDWFQGLIACVVIGRSLDFALSPDGMLKNGETVAGQISHPSRMIEAMQLIINMRGLGFQWSRGLRVPPYTRSQLRTKFLMQTLVHLIRFVLSYDILVTIVDYLRQVRRGEVEGGLVYYELSATSQYLYSLFLSDLGVASVYCGFWCVYDALTLIAVGVFNDLPSSWPPLMGKPWMSSSVIDFWGWEYHQFFRRVATVCGGLPGRWIAGRVGFVIGTFFMSGLFHELPAYAMGHGLEWGPVLYFLSQSVVLLGEAVYRYMVGKRTQGLAGRIWTHVAVMGPCPLLMDSWLRRIASPYVFLPPSWSPAGWVLRTWGSTMPFWGCCVAFLIPLLSELLASYRDNISF